MENRHRTDVTSIAEFLQFIQDKVRLGYDVLGNKRPYHSYDVLQTYWTRANIQAILKTESLHFVPCIDTIREDYLRVLSMLVYGDEISHLSASFLSTNLHDGQLPLSKPSLQWPNAPLYAKLFDSISSCQWHFFPFIFDRNRLLNRRLAPEHVLPILSREVIQEGEVADVYKIILDDTYNALVEQVGHTIQKTSSAMGY